MQLSDCLPGKTDFRCFYVLLNKWLAGQFFTVAGNLFLGLRVTGVTTDVKTRKY